MRRHVVAESGPVAAVLLAAFGLAGACAGSAEESSVRNNPNVSDNDAAGGSPDAPQQGEGASWPDVVAPDGAVWPEGGAGSGASGGTAGTGGTGGTAGTGGTSGAAGTGGTSGAAGTAGSAGSGGSGACAASWRTHLTVDIADVKVDSTGTLYVAGTQGTYGWVGSFDPCTGKQLGARTLAVPGATSTSLVSLVLSGANVLVAGSSVLTGDAGEGTYARLDKQSLSVAGAWPLFGSAGTDEIWGIALASSGDLWMAGATDVAVSPRAWGVKGTANGQACGFPGPFSGAGAAHAVAASGTNVYVAAMDGSQLVLVQYGDSVCSSSPPCPCSPVWQSAKIAVGTAGTDPRSMLVIGGHAFVAGFAWDSALADSFAFVSQIALGTGTVVGTYRYDPTTQIDAFLGLATDGQRLYVSGGRGWDGQSGYQSVSALLAALPTAITNTTAPHWVASPLGLHVMWKIDSGAGASGGVYGTTSDKVLFKCEKSGVCPP
jgi:hypothetical protein